MSPSTPARPDQPRAGFSYRQICPMLPECGRARGRAYAERHPSGAEPAVGLARTSRYRFVCRCEACTARPDEVLFLADDPGDGCYRIEDGLLKVAMVSRAGNERILAFLG